MSTNGAPSEPREPLPPTEWKVTLHEEHWTIQALPDGPETTMQAGQVMVIETGGPGPWRAGMMAAVLPEGQRRRPARKKK